MASKETSYQVVAFDYSKASDVEAQKVCCSVVDEYARGRGRWPVPEIPTLADGPRLLEKDAAWNRRCVLALAEQVEHWQSEEDALRKANGDQVSYYHISAKGERIAPTAMLAGIREALSLLLRRKLPLTSEDLVYLARVCVERQCSDYMGVPPAGIQKQAEFYAKNDPIEGELHEWLQKLSEHSRSPHGRSADVAAKLDSLLQEPGKNELRILGEAPPPAFVGSRNILVDLKIRLGVLADRDTEKIVAEDDPFARYIDSPLAAEHIELVQTIQAFQHAFAERQTSYLQRDPEARKRAIELCQDRERQAIEALVSRGMDVAHSRLAAYERIVDLYLRSDGASSDYHAYRSRLQSIVGYLDERETLFSREQAFDWLLYRSTIIGYRSRVDSSVAQGAESYVGAEQPSDGERWVIHRLRSQAIDTPPMGALPEVARRLSQLIDGDATLLLVPGEHWADCVHLDLSTMDEVSIVRWTQMVRLAFAATASKPSSKWLKELKTLVEAIGAEELRDRVTSWFAKVPAGRSFKVLGGYIGDSRGAADTFNDGNATVLRGLVWAIVAVADANTPRVVSELLATCIKKVPGVGPRAVKVANACVWALGELASSKDEEIRINALGQLARLKARVTFKTTLKAIEKALDKAAAESGLPRDEIEEMAVPTYGLEEVGKRVEQLGDFTAELVVTGTTSTELRWLKPDGKPQKSVPKSVKDHFPDDLKELKAAAKDIEKMLPALRDRIDLLHIKQKTWAYDTWLERYLDHPLVGTIARRLIWQFDEGEHKPKIAATWLDGKLVDACGEEVSIDLDAAIVSLWHPIGHNEADVLAWRRFFEDRQVKQPFKQAHREIYLLTDAERNTGVYSNRYASHIVKQHQYNALCGIRGWSNQLRLMVDADYPPSSIRLPEWNLRAEFWVEGVGDGYGTDTNESGTYLYLSTDQVRFYSLNAAANSAHAGGGGYGSRAAGPGTNNVNDPIPLEQIPPLVLSEVLRDVDLFVGVASVGNDPTWNDGGPEGRYRTYWQETSFGDLSATAQTRREILQRLVPRLKIADRCAFDDKFLVVRGERRTYKIHLGSSNILMEPNDQYLCIVPGRGDGGGDKVFLPFEGDQRLAVILSKAMMLAEDTKITDPTILSQIGR